MKANSSLLQRAGIEHLVIANLEGHVDNLSTPLV